MLRANRETAEVESPKQLAHASFVQGDAKLGRDAITQIGPAEPHNAERAMILKALEEARGQVGGPDGAAARLGMKRTTLQSRMRKFNISREFC